MKKRGLSLHIILRPFLFLLFCGLFPLHLSAQHTESVIGKDNVGRLIEPSQPIEHIFLNVDPSFVGTLNQQYTPSTGDTLSYNINYNDLHIIKDHLDSPRKIFTNLTVRERNYYYPFGLRTDQGRAYPTFSDRYTVKVPRLTQGPNGTITQTGYRATAPYTLQYNGKELQLLANTTLIDYGARQYNPVTARWTTQDPMAEKYYGISPYAYCIGNPINLVDENGEDWWDIIKGILAAVYDNVTLGLTDIREQSGKKVNNFKDFNKGLTAGDAASLALGAMEINSGAGLTASGAATAAVGVAVAPITGGTSLVATPVGAGEAIAGTALAIHGGAVIMSAGKNLAEKKGHWKEADGNSSSKKGTQTNSNTIWRDKIGRRIDVENPNPTNRSGNIHYHSEGKKYMLNMGDGKFYSKNPKTGKWDVPAPSKINKELSKPEIQKAINKGKKYIGYE